MDHFQKASQLLKEFKGNNYVFGSGVLAQIGTLAHQKGKKAVLISEGFPGIDPYIEKIRNSLNENSVQLVKLIIGARPNAPTEDLLRITKEVRSADPDLVISFGGGSTIDASKAAIVLSVLGGDIDDYFGTGLVTEALKTQSKVLIPHIAVQTLASSASHLTKYSNITDVGAGQKKLIVDEAIIPEIMFFDWDITYSTPMDITKDGAFDGIAHCLEVLYGTAGKPGYKKIAEVAETGIELIVEHLPKVIENPGNQTARQALCLGTDLGGYCIMMGGTNGAHLTSFSLVDLLSHGRACAMMNPYYTVFFAPAIEKPLKLIADILKRNRFIDGEFHQLNGRDLGVAVAEGFFRMANVVDFPICLKDLPGFSTEHIERALKAAKNPQLRMKLQNMPVPLTAEMVDDYMRPVLLAAMDGDLNLIKNV